MPAHALKKISIITGPRDVARSALDYPRDGWEGWGKVVKLDENTCLIWHGIHFHTVQTRAKHTDWPISPLLAEYAELVKANSTKKNWPENLTAWYVLPFLNTGINQLISPTAKLTDSFPFAIDRNTERAQLFVCLMAVRTCLTSQCRFHGFSDLDILCLNNISSAENFASSSSVVCDGLGAGSLGH